MDDFKNSYKKAYENILPSPGYIERIADRVDERRRREKRRLLLTARPVIAVCAVVLLLSVTALPVMARSYPAVYNIVEKYAPALSDFVLPVKVSDTSNGITMQVEAIDIKDNEAEVLVSFCDEEGSGKDLIKGKVDLYDSYYLQNYGESSGIGGCSFLEYDETEDKAYFKISLSTDGNYDMGKTRFGVHQLLCNVSKEKKQIELNDIIRNPDMKPVSLNGKSGMDDNDIFSKYMGKSTDDSPMPKCQVMDIVKADESMAQTLTVTGVGYSDGILRIQICRGNFGNTDRHVRLFAVDSEGNELESDVSVMWHEETGEGGESLIFDEDWFLIDESELDSIQLYGIFYIVDGSVEGDWEVTFKLEPFYE